MDFDGYFCVEDAHLNDDYTSDNDNHVILSENAPSVIKWNNDTREILLAFNKAQKESQECLKNELYHIINKIKATSLKQNEMFKDLVELKYRKESPISKVCVSSNISSFKNNYENLCEFLGTLFCSWLGFNPKQALNNKYAKSVYHPDMQSKSMDYGKYTKA